MSSLSVSTNAITAHTGRYIIVWLHRDRQPRWCRVPPCDTATDKDEELAAHEEAWQFVRAECHGPYLVARVVLACAQRHIIWNLQGARDLNGEYRAVAVFDQHTTLLAGCYFLCLIPNAPASPDSNVENEHTVLIYNLRVSPPPREHATIAKDVTPSKGVVRRSWSSQSSSLANYRPMEDIVGGTFILATDNEQFGKADRDLSLLRVDDTGPLDNKAAEICTMASKRGLAPTTVLGGSTKRLIISARFRRGSKYAGGTCIECYARQPDNLLWCIVQPGMLRNVIVIDAHDRLVMLTWEHRLHIYSLEDGAPVFTYSWSSLYSAQPITVIHVLGAAVLLSEQSVANTSNNAAPPSVMLDIGGNDSAHWSKARKQLARLEQKCSAGQRKQLDQMLQTKNSPTKHSPDKRKPMLREKLVCSSRSLCLVEDALIVMDMVQDL
ncbi:hypothetical protein THASP1DRAFT_29984 [Thamnocephalis sphaerospora]|uniref:Uncharacterized protein n=1 Tax=Thamnocephalis sphaerospora TaxID=78915 RepID=A0A4P9XQK9_9FUNG|nr:hypothetical protein THASP1DRAFT_29984 [Thamnocephalis sphaerospora]|eukprot:RKP08202.1 hypothetical protein THASP1DRAFT_29984 [Thamnocephalis sphaerospora]